MLELLDVAIGFATVMLAVSLIIMSLTQAPQPCCGWPGEAQRIAPAPDRLPWN